MATLIECVPNFSEGRNAKTIQTIGQAIAGESGVRLLHTDSNFSAHRTVYTFAGPAEAVILAAYKAIQVAAETVDMRKHRGEHPRIGACDVCPFIPISGISSAELQVLVREFAEKCSKDFNMPVFLYEDSARVAERKNLGNHRRGEYEGLENRLQTGRWKADFGEQFNPASGGMVTGVRNFLIAYNINLNTTDAAIAKEIAFDLRELGRPIAREDNKIIYKPGKLKKVKAIGWYIADFDKAQVSVNLTDFRTTSLFQVFDTTSQLAQEYGVKVTGSELIGLIPKAALMPNAGKPDATEEQVLESAVKYLGLDELAPFELNKRVLEYVLANSE
jgi:glutamate formiminotransferase/formiminotetrahydrofolate cyclodeaminase